MTEAEEMYLEERLTTAESMETSGITLEMVRTLWRDYRMACQLEMGSELGAACLRLAHHHMLQPGSTCRVLAVSVQGVALGTPKAIVDVRLEVTQP